MLLLLLPLLVVCAVGALELTAHNTVWVLHPNDAGYGAPAPYAAALRDLQRDWYKRIGAPPVTIISDRPGAEALPAGFAGVAIFLFSAADSLPQSEELVHEEEHGIFREVSEEVTLIGAAGTSGDIRAHVFAAYSLSERILGVEPLWFWTNTEPEYSGGVLALDPSGLEFRSGEPRFKRRGWFPNDEDLLGGFSPDPLGKSVFSADTWDKMIEALLRLKGNLILPGTVAFPDESCYEVARRRGVYVSQQHFTLLGVNTWRWPKGVPYSHDKNPEMQRYVWEGSVAAYAGRDTVWTIGYRGLNDYPFWIDEPEFDTTSKRCRLVSDAMAAQASVVRNTLGRSGDQCATYLWSEMLDLYKAGCLELPDNTTLVFADANGSGEFDPAVKDLVGPGDGVYYHVQMEAPGLLAQLTEMVPPATTFRELRTFVEKNATSLFVLNLSDLIPAVLTVDTVMRFLWNPNPYLDVTDPADAQRVVLEDWSRRFFGEPWVQRAADALTAYFNIEYIAGVKISRKGEQHLADKIRGLLDGTVAPGDALAFAKTPTAQVVELDSSASVLHEDMVAAGARGADFFASSVLLHVKIHRYSLEAVADAANGDLDAAILAINAMLEAQRNAEGTKWRGLYAADILDDFFQVRCLLAQRRDQLRDQREPWKGQCNLASGAAWRGGTGDWSPWFEYAATSDNFPYLTTPADEYSMRSVVRALCSNGACSNTPVGGTFSGSAVVELTCPACSDANIAPDSTLEIRYTTDGSEPDETSALYAGVVLSRLKICERVFAYDAIV